MSFFLNLLKQFTDDTSEIQAPQSLQTPAEMPALTSADARRARRIAMTEQLARKGRASTILTDEDTLGGGRRMGGSLILGEGAGVAPAGISDAMAAAQAVAAGLPVPTAGTLITPSQRPRYVRPPGVQP